MRQDDAHMPHYIRNYSTWQRYCSSHRLSKTDNRHRCRIGIGGRARYNIGITKGIILVTAVRASRTDSTLDNAVDFTASATF